MYIRARSLLSLFLGLLGIGSLGGCIEWECQRSPALPDCHRLDLTEIKVRNQSTLSGRIWGPLLPQTLHARGPGAEFRIEQEEGQCQLKEWEVDADGSFSIRVNPEDLRSCQQSSQAELVAAAGSLEVRHPVTLALTKLDKVTPVALQPPQEDTASAPSIIWAGAKAPQGTLYVLWKKAPEAGKTASMHHIQRYRLVGSTLQRIDPLNSSYRELGQVAKAGMTAEHIVSYEGASAKPDWYDMLLGKTEVSGELPVKPTAIEGIQGSYLSQMAADPGGDLLLIASRSLPPPLTSPEASLIARRVDGRKIAVHSDPMYDVSMLHTMIAGRLEGDKDTVCLLVRKNEQYIDVLRMDESGQVLTQDPELASRLKKGIQENPKTKPGPQRSSPIAEVGAIGDLDGDGKNEIVLLRSDPISGPTQDSQFVQRLLIIWNPLTEQRTVEVQDLPNFVLNPGEILSALSIADLNGDKRPDLVVVSGRTRITEFLDGRIWFIPNPGFGM